MAMHSAGYSNNQDQDNNRQPQMGGYSNHPEDGFGHGGGDYGVPNSLKASALASTSNHMNDVFFAASCCVVFGAFISGSELFFNFEPVDAMNMAYLTAFGATMAVLDTPFLKSIKMVVDAKTYIGKYLQLVTRVTGKGVTLVFLGSSLFLSMWDNLQGPFMRFLAVVLSTVPTVVGFAACTVGLLKSAKLDKARRQLAFVIDHRYDHFASTYRGADGGLTMAEFNNLTTENGGFRFETLDLKLIFNALVSNPAWRAQPTSNAGYANVEEPKIPKHDLIEWCNGGMVLL